MFATQLSKVVEHAFAAVGGEAGVDEATTTPKAPVEDQVVLPPVEALDVPEALVEAVVLQDADLGVIVEDADAPKMEQLPDSLPARMLNEFVYCPRLFYYEHVEGVFVESADTVRGAVVHARVDKGKGALPQAKSTSGGGDGGQAQPAAEGEQIHSRSVMLGSERLGVVAKMDLV